MEEYKVLITTSGTGNRLGNLTKYTNKSLVRVGKRPSISYIVEKYSPDVELVVTLGHFGNQVKDFLELAYPTRKFTFVKVNPYEGDGSSLLYSILCAKKELQCPFIFHACDTITFDQINPPTFNWCAAYKTTTAASQYRTHNVVGNKLVRINEKGESHFDRVHIGMCGIKDYQVFWKYAEELYAYSPHDTQHSDCHVINMMLNNNPELPIKSLPFSSWLDVGNVEKLKEARENIPDKFQLLDKMEESISIFDDSVIKFFYDNRSVETRVERAIKLGPLVPPIIGVRPHFYKYQYVEGTVLSETVDESKIVNLLLWANSNLWKKLGTSDQAAERCKKFYFDKTATRIGKFLSENNIKDTTQNINGIAVPSVAELIGGIKPGLLCNNDEWSFHGDFILDNIIYIGPNKFVLIDWRQEFEGSLTGGDMYYDLAKLNHSLIFSHRIVNAGGFTIEFDNDNVSCDILRSHILTECQQQLFKFISLNGLSMQKIELLTPIVWLNMSPLHEYPINIFLFYFGRYQLFKAMRKYL